MSSDFQKEHLAETYKSLLSLSVEAFKYAALINGGAVVALLAYLGNLTRDTRPIPDLRAAMLWFLIGLAACGVGFLSAYLVQLRLFTELRGTAKVPIDHRVILAVAVFSYIGSLASFCAGAWLAIKAFLAAGGLTS
jgi:hypothetical protein